MRLRTPQWWAYDGWIPRLMSPLGTLFDMAGGVRRLFASPKKTATPIICVGNLVVGGAGKTPTCIALAELLSEDKRRVVLLSKGYGGKLKGPVWVDPAAHSVEDVGDEALLLAAKAPTVVANDRAAGAALADEKADVIIMDDGHQNPHLEKTLSLIVIDGTYSFGNGRVVPAGPLREGLEKGMRRADGVLIIGDDVNNLQTLIRLKYTMPVITAALKLDAIPAAVLNRSIVAFAGIGRPEKFFDAVRACGADIVDSLGFPDHYTYTERDIRKLERLAQVNNAHLVTTEKDFVRLPEPFRSSVKPLPARVLWDDVKPLRALLNTVFSNG